MNKRKTIIAVILVVVVGVGLLSLLPQEPTYQGRSLESWVDDVDKNPHDQAAVDGLHKLLPVALPYYVKQLKKRDTALAKAYEAIWSKLPEIIASHLPKGLPADTIRLNAILILKYVGSDARAAAPDLIQAFKDEDEGVRQCAVESFAQIKPDGRTAIPALIAALADPFIGVRRMAAESLLVYGSEASAAVPALTLALHDPDKSVCACSAGALWHINRQTNAVMDALNVSMKDKNPGARALAAMYYGHVGPAAESDTVPLESVVRARML